MLWRADERRGAEALYADAARARDAMQVFADARCLRYAAATLPSPFRFCHAP